MEFDLSAVLQAQVAWLLVRGIRILLATMPQLVQEAVATRHQIYHFVMYHLRFEDCAAPVIEYADRNKIGLRAYAYVTRDI